MDKYIDVSKIKYHNGRETVPTGDYVSRADIENLPAADVDYERGFIEGYTKAESDIFHGGKYAPVKHGRWELKYHKLWGRNFPTCTVCVIRFMQQDIALTAGR